MRFRDLIFEFVVIGDIYLFLNDGRKIMLSLTGGTHNQLMLYYYINAPLGS